MMREIEFRGRSTINGEWFYGNLYTTDVNGRTHITNPTRGCLCIDPHSVGQYIGRTDRNGRKIYEGDILDFYDDECGKPNNLCGSRLEVLWLSDESRFGYKNRVPDHEYCSGFNGLWRENHYVVIGNIYDNPELLNTAEYGEREIRKHQI